MDRIRVLGNIIGTLPPLQSVLDVGCRDGALADKLPASVEYFGADLFPGERVRYAGDIASIEFDRTFDLVVAADVLEHTETPSTIFDKIATLATRYMIVTLPNCYDLKSIYKFALRGQLGGKYVFSADEPLDRHRWLMNRAEIIAFYEAKASKFGFNLTVLDIKYGDSGSNSFSARGGRLFSRIMPARLWSSTVIGVFEAPPR